MNALEVGRRKHVTEQRKRAIARVRVYENWLRSGARMARIPPIPSDNDFKVAKGER